MAQDIRDLINEAPKEQHINMSVGHEARFLQKLEKKLPQQRSTYRSIFSNIAASVVILLGLSYGVYQFYQSPTDSVKVADNTIDSLGDVSPDFKKVEDYYIASINLELSKVKLTADNKELFDGYVQRLKELNEEYNTLTIELKKYGPNEKTLDALIDNLKFRLNFVMRLKQKLQEFNDDTFKQESI